MSAATTVARARREVSRRRAAKPSQTTLEAAPLRYDPDNIEPRMPAGYRPGPVLAALIRRDLAIARAALDRISAAVDLIA